VSVVPEQQCTNEDPRHSFLLKHPLISRGLTYVSPPSFQRQTHQGTS